MCFEKNKDSQREQSQREERESEKERKREKREKERKREREKEERKREREKERKRERRKNKRKIGNFLVNKLIWTHWWRGTHGWLVCRSQHSVHLYGERLCVLLIFNETVHFGFVGALFFSKHSAVFFAAPRTKFLKMTDCLKRELFITKTFGPIVNVALTYEIVNYILLLTRNIISLSTRNHHIYLEVCPSRVCMVVWSCAA